MNTAYTIVLLSIDWDFKNFVLKTPATWEAHAGSLTSW